MPESVVDKYRSTVELKRQDGRTPDRNNTGQRDLLFRILRAKLRVLHQEAQKERV